MSSKDDFEFEIDDEEEEIRKPRTTRPKGQMPKKPPVKTGKPKNDKTPSKKKGMSTPKETIIKPPSQKAKRNPVPEGIKRKLAIDLREIRNLNKELREFKDEKESFEHELELMEDEIESIRSEKDRLEEEVNKQIALVGAYEKKLNRNQKDFDNFRKRTKTDIDRQVKMGQKKLFLGMIEIIDNYDRAIEEGKKFDHKPEVSKVIEGIDSIRRNMLKLLSDNGVEMIDPLDEAFDPHFHEAIEIITNRSVPENTVVKVESKGYLMGDIVLRPAKVNVSKGGEQRKKKPAPEKERADDEEELSEMDDVEEMLEDMEE